MNKYVVMNTLFSAIGGAIIGGTVAILASRKHYEDYVVEEVDKVRRQYALLRKEDGTLTYLAESETDGFPTDEEVAEAHNLMAQVGYHNPDDSPIDSTDPAVQNVFSRSVPEEEVGEEIPGLGVEPPKKKNLVYGTDDPGENVLSPDDPMFGYERISGEPYIISQDQFYNEETEWDKPSISYYPGDDVLVDERGVIMDETHRQRYVGERHLRMFGVLSEDENIVYVRSPQTSVDFEILMEPGKYSVLVLGETDYEEVERIRASRQAQSEESD